MKRPIVSDPGILDGAPHIEGTMTTVAEIQNFWRQPGIGAQAAREQFPHLSEGELGAAVTWSEPREPEFSFVADQIGPPRRKYRLWSESTGWMFAYDECDPDGKSRPGHDTWEETWDAILQYAPSGLEWRDDKTGEVIDVAALTIGRR